MGVDVGDLPPCPECGGTVTPKSGNVGGLQRRYCTIRCRDRAAYRRLQRTPEQRARRQERQREYQRRLPPKHKRAYWLWAKYRLTTAAYDEIFVGQGEGCALCGAAPGDLRSLAVDHDHTCCPGSRSCGRCVRGLLCTLCNKGLGQFYGDPARLRAAADYIEGYQRRADRSADVQASTEGAHV